MAIKVPLHVIPYDRPAPSRNQYAFSLENMFEESVRVDSNFCTYYRWVTTDYTSPFSEFKSGFLSYLA